MAQAQKKYKEASDRHKADHSFQVGDRVWLYLPKERFKEKERKIKPLRYGPYFITEQLGANAFRLDLPPYMGLHPVFNVDKLKLFEPSLVDEIEETQRHPDAVIPDFTSPLDEDKIFEQQMKKTQTSSFDSFLVGRKGQYPHQAKWITLDRLRTSFSHLLEKAMGSIAFLGGRN